MRYTTLVSHVVIAPILQTAPSRPLQSQRWRERITRGATIGIAEYEQKVGYRIGRDTQWTNPSVLAIAADGDRISSIIDRAREVATRAMDEGWEGPPFDPRRLAGFLSIEVLSNSQVRDVRVSTTDGQRFTIELNPTRASVRQRFSLAHEIAHTFCATR